MRRRRGGWLRVVKMGRNRQLGGEDLEGDEMS